MTFTRVYGYDLLQWPGYPVLAVVREFIMVTWMVLKAAESDRTSAEAQKRFMRCVPGAAVRTGTRSSLGLSPGISGGCRCK